MWLFASCTSVLGSDWESSVNLSQTFLSKCFSEVPMLLVIPTIQTMLCLSKYIRQAFISFHVFGHCGVIHLLVDLNFLETGSICGNLLFDGFLCLKSEKLLCNYSISDSLWPQLTKYTSVPVWNLILSLFCCLLVGKYMYI